jgi:hypothetical protein
LKTLEWQVESTILFQISLESHLFQSRNILEGWVSSAIAPVLITAITKIIGL